MNTALPTEKALKALRNAYRSDKKLAAALNLAAKNCAAGRPYKLPAKSGPYRDAQRAAVWALAAHIPRKQRNPERTVYQIKVGAAFRDVPAATYRDQNTGVDLERPGTRQLKQYAPDIDAYEAASIYEAEAARVQKARATAPAIEDQRFVRDTSQNTPVASQPHFFDVDKELLEAEAAAAADRLVWHARATIIDETFVHQPVRPDYSRELAKLAQRQAFAKPLVTPTAKRIVLSDHAKQLELDQLECEAFFVADELDDTLNVDLEEGMVSASQALANSRR